MPKNNKYGATQLHPKMKFMHKLLLSIAFALGLGLHGSAQLSVDQTTGIVGLPDSANMGDTLNLSYKVINKGPLPLVNTPILSWMSVNGNLIATPVDSSFVSNFAVGDTIVVPINSFIVSPQNNNNGGANVVVVWPTAPGGNTDDTLRDTMHVDQPNSSAPIVEDILQAFPNPFDNLLRIKYEGPEQLGYVTLLDSRGRESMRIPDSQLNINTEHLKPGYYTLIVETSNGRLVSKKLLKYR